MPVLYQFTGSVLVVRGVGAYPLRELEEAVRAALAHPQRPALRGAVFDDPAEAFAWAER